MSKQFLAKNALDAILTVDSEPQHDFSEPLNKKRPDEIYARSFFFISKDVQEQCTLFTL